MGWSLNIGRIAGTAVRIHITFLLFLGWIFIASWYSGGPQAAWSGLAFAGQADARTLVDPGGNVDS